jgi:UDP-N-acetylglucosamine:LPS N-acetylglucosamine transferase
VKGLILEYLKGVKNNDNVFTFHLITHEQNEFALTKLQRVEKENSLNALNIKWYPIKYRNGNLLLLKKIFNFLQTFIITLKIKLKFKPVAILGFLSIAGGYSYILSKLFNLKLIVYCFEPHSEYMLDFKIWSENSLKYKLLHKFEQLQIKNSDSLIVPNQFTKTLVEDYKKDGVYVCPISIDTNQMVFDLNARESIRKKLNIENRKVIIYTGKFGGIYYSSDDVISYFSKLYFADKNLFFYIITPNLEDVKKSIASSKLLEAAYHLSFTVNYSELNKHISAADIGFVALPSLPSQKYRTPVKTAIYLSCGLPYLVNKNIGEDDVVATKEAVGVVIENLQEAPSFTINKINALLEGDIIQLRNKCRQVAETTRSISVATSILNNIFSEL